MMRRVLVFVVFLSGSILCLRGQDHFRVAFYNVENLFDTKDDPEKRDEDFTPDGRNAWDDVRYLKKLDQLAKVIEGLDFPAIVGFAEVENAQVLRDLSYTDALQKQSYGVVHYESPDVRGIDVGLFYQKNVFHLDTSYRIRVEFPLWLEPEGYTSRDILVTKLSTESGESFVCFTNHWPSRRGGEAESEHRRLWVASHLRRAIDDVLLDDYSTKVIVMGDFNDEPHNRSVSQVLGALPDTLKRHVPGVLYNHFTQFAANDNGSYNYRGDWNMLDQIITSGFQTPNPWAVERATIFKPKWLLYGSGEKARPNRTYGGPNYYGGYSDHLPIYVDFILVEGE